MALLGARLPGGCAGRFGLHFRWTVLLCLLLTQLGRGDPAAPTPLSSHEVRPRPRAAQDNPMHRAPVNWAIWTDLLGAPGRDLQCIEEEGRLHDDQRVCWFRNVFFWHGRLFYVSNGEHAMNNLGVYWWLSAQ